MSNYIINSPLDQFVIQPLFILDSVIQGKVFQFTNFVLFFLIIFITIVGINVIGVYSQKIIGGRWTLSQESLFTTIQEMVYSQIGGSKGQYYFPFIYTLFILILISNLLGMIPYSFAVTSHLVYTISLSVVVFLGVTILGASIHLQKFFGLFVPQGCPLALVPLLVFIELLSYLARSVSLGLRLGANILSGHMLMVILGGFIYNIMSSGIIYFFIGFIPLSVVFGIMGLEFAIAAIQAYVFSILACSYIKDALYLH